MKISNTLVVLDLETTGTWVDKDKIIEIAMIKVPVEGPRETYDQRVNPGISISSVVTELTGIRNEDVQEAPSFIDIAKEVADFIGDADLGGFNVERFDLPVLEREFSEAGLPFKWRLRNIFDAQKVFHVNEKRDLTSAFKFYCQKDLENAHSAMADTQATLDILSAQVDKYGNGQECLDELRKFDYKGNTEFFDDERKFRWWNGKLYMMFGKYARKYTLQEVVKRDRGYLQWIVSANFGPQVKELIEEALEGKFPPTPKKNKESLK